LSSNGSRPSISTLLVVGSDDRVHVCYVADGTTKTLHYRTINAGVVGIEDITIANGGWHTRMQLDENNYPIFVREGRTWPALKTKLALLTTQDGTTWNSEFLNLPSVVGFRIADFVYSNGIYHITYGGSEHLKEVWSTKDQINRVKEIFHNLHYASSSDGLN
jgi:hypothetical protein